MTKPRHGARVDDTQRDIIDVLEAAGAKVLVLDLAPTEDGKGEPDVLVGWLGTLTLLENKSRGGKLSDDQLRKHEEWARVGVKVGTAHSGPEALRLVGITGAAVVERQKAMREFAHDLNPAGAARRALRPSVKRYA